MYTLYTKVHTDMFSWMSGPPDLNAANIPTVAAKVKKMPANTPFLNLLIVAFALSANKENNAENAIHYNGSPTTTASLAIAVFDDLRTERLESQLSQDFALLWKRKRSENYVNRVIHVLLYSSRPSMLLS